MGKGGKPKVEVSFYYMSLHYGICIGPPDKIIEITVKDKTAWSGEADTMQALTVNQRDLFGGDQKEGGLIGTVHYLPGEVDQVLPDTLAQRLGRANGADCPGFRGIASIFFYRQDTTRGFYWAANTPFLPGAKAKLQRILKRSDGSAQWYPTKATIGGTVISFDEVWKYQTEAPGSPADYSARDYDDSAWASGPGGFGNNPSGYFTPPSNTILFGGGVPAGSIIWTRKHLGPLDPNPIALDVWHDDSSRVWFNGVEIETTAVDYFHSTGIIPSSLIDAGGDNVIAMKATDSVPLGNPTYIYSGAQLSLSTGQDMNPAHIIHECLTDTAWGMGTPVAGLDDSSFVAAADTLYDENFGLSMVWTRQASIEDFIQEILDHIQGVLYVDPSTGLLTLALIRGDYDPDTLDIITPENADLSNFSRKLWGDIVNEIVVTWTNPANEQEETLTVQDDGSIAIQGTPVSDSRNYYGVRNAELAQALAFRDLRSAGQPLVSCDAEVDRTQWTLRPASVVKLTWPEYGLSEIVMRVQSVDYGRPGDPTIKLGLLEDVFGLDIGDYDSPPSTEWVDPSALPGPMEFVDIFTLPLYFSLNSGVAAFVETPEYPEVLAGILASTENSDTYAYELWDEIAQPTGDLEWQSIGEKNVVGRAELVFGLAAEVETAGVTFDEYTGNTAPTVGGFVIIGESGEAGNEICLVTSIDGGDYDLQRGCLDTIPRAWPAGTACWFVDAATVYEDDIIRAAAEVVSYRLLTRTSRGLLALEDAPDESATLTERPWLPSRPANVTAYGEAWSSQLAPIDATARPDPWVTVTWAIRNRLDEDGTVLAWDDPSMTPEAGQTTTIEVRDPLGVLLATHDLLGGTSYNVPDTSFGTENLVELRVYSERSVESLDFVSLQYFSHWVQVGVSVRVTEDDEARLTEDGESRLTED